MKTDMHYGAYPAIFEYAKSSETIRPGRKKKCGAIFGIIG